MRFVLIAAWIIVVVALLLPLLRRRRLPRAGEPAALRDELVKDPVCETYVVRSRAVSRDTGHGPLYFCSAECARRHAGR